MRYLNDNLTLSETCAFAPCFCYLLAKLANGLASLNLDFLFYYFVKKEYCIHRLKDVIFEELS